MSNNNIKIIVLTGIVILAVALRLIPHVPNVTPVMAIALFSGAFFSDKKLAMLVPVTIMLLSDLFIGIHTISFVVYPAFITAVGIGYFLRDKQSPSKVIFASLSASIVFFLITNFASWLIMPQYQPLTTASLLTCYEMALPFFRNALVGDLLYSAILFGAWAVARKRVPVLA